MDTINPVSNDLASQISDLQTKFRQLNNGRQPYVGDWFDFNPNDFSFNTATLINVPNFTPSNFFGIGGQLKIIQSGVTSYFFVTQVNTTTIAIDGGTGYTFTSATITSISYSNKFPSDFPGASSFTKNNSISPVSYAGATTYTTSAITESFYMRGREVNYNIGLTLTVGGGAAGGAQWLSIDLPVQRTLVTDITFLSGFQTTTILKNGINPYAMYPLYTTVNKLYFALMGGVFALGDTSPFTFATWDSTAGSFTYLFQLSVRYTLNN